MNKSESLRKLLHSMNDFASYYDFLRDAIRLYEADTGESVNDIPGFTENYPFNVSFDELTIRDWVDTTIERVSQKAFKVLKYNYLNTGGGTMVGIFEVWLPSEKRVVYAMTNEEGCTLSVVDYISNELDIDDYDEIYIDTIDWGRATGYEKYFELYRYCLNEYIKSDCRAFGYTRELPYFLLSDELQKQVDTDYLVWLESEDGSVIETDGFKIIEHPDYTAGLESAKHLQEVKDFNEWHAVVPDDYDVRESLYDKDYVLTLADHTVRIPFNADTWNAIDELLTLTIREW